MSVRVIDESETTRTGPLPPPIGAFELSELPQLTSDYLHSIEVRVTRVTGNLVPPQQGSFSVRVTNGPIRLTGWTLHLTSTDPGVAKIVAGGVSPLIVFRTTGDASTPTAPAGSEHATLFVFFQGNETAEPDSVLEPGEVRDFRFTFKAIGPGDGSFTAHLHGTVDVDSLFPRGRGTDGDASVEVLRP